jgi:hypothetical protein
VLTLEGKRRQGGRWRCAAAAGGGLPRWWCSGAVPAGGRGRGCTARRPGTPGGAGLKVNGSGKTWAAAASSAMAGGGATLCRCGGAPARSCTGREAG